MLSTQESLATQLVSEVMVKEVVALRETETMHSAIQKIQAGRISGAPVIDQYGHCMGVISLADFTDIASPSNKSHKDQWFDLVQDHMTSPAVSILPTATIQEAALLMCTKRVHRLPVVDEEGLTLGMVSSLDIVSSIIS